MKMAVSAIFCRKGIDDGPPSILETPTPSQPAKRKRNEQTEPTARPALQQTGRTQQAPLINRPTGLQTLTHAQADNDATTALNSIWNEIQQRQDAKRAVLSLVARSLDSIVASCQNDLKETAKEVTGLFSTFLTSMIWLTVVTHERGGSIAYRITYTIM